jgi:hypothetical protein
MFSSEHRKAVLEEVQLIVMEALREGDRVRADGLAKVVASSYPHSGLTSTQIAERIREAAGVAGVAVEPGILYRAA